MKAFLTGIKIRLLNLGNKAEYIEAPNGVFKFWRCGKMSYKTYEELNEIKQLWRESHIWKPGMHLF